MRVFVSKQINESDLVRNIIKKSNSDLPSMKLKHSNNYRPVFVFSPGLSAQCFCFSLFLSVSLDL